MNATLLKMAVIVSWSIVFMQNVAKTRRDARQPAPSTQDFEPQSKTSEQRISASFYQLAPEERDDPRTCAQRTWIPKQTQKIRC
ncbi:hypothetical protein [Bradyrhizobium arachidis]|uniref:Uncharacterized protein n=1 Tax=Bradyrhizobium arachidis TaxID=858423 RepID=A0AAE7NYQ9_9BRAD|nr:hypothetical protein [Bradyrhizobium arachidis]QOZ71913.1 hypothetical protein WN72_40725 [Bradyrhizobium arachidis]